MRLSTKKTQHIKNSLKKLAPESEVYIFGSRADDSAKGGDIVNFTYDQEDVFKDIALSQAVEL